MGLITASIFKGKGYYILILLVRNDYIGSSFFPNGYQENVQDLSLWFLQNS